MRIGSYILSAKEILSQYDGRLPFAVWVKDIFRAHKKFGSRDRKIITHLCYSFFRMGKAFSDLPIQDRIGLGLFLTTQDASPLLEQLNGEWSHHANLLLEEKLAYLNAEDELVKIFPLPDLISDDIDSKAFLESHFIQPNLFLRMRPGKEQKVMQGLTAAGIAFRDYGLASLVLENTTRVDEALQLDEEAVVQDLSSQQVLYAAKEYFTSRAGISVWDCCAASGGKSILAYDTFSHINLTVSDIRSSILKNLHSRFASAGITKYHSFVADIGGPQFVPAKKYDLVICDAPCSGSGTWSRTPEQLSLFTKEKLEYYSNLQKWIGLNAAKAVETGGALLYITCSVYKQENEDVVQYLQQKTGLQLRSRQYYKGYDKRADTLFAALFIL